MNNLPLPTIRMAEVLSAFSLATDLAGCGPWDTSSVGPSGLDWQRKINQGAWLQSPSGDGAREP